MNWWVLRRRLHVSWLVMILSLSFVVGVWLAQWIDTSLLGATVWILTASLAIGIVLWRRTVYLIPLLLIAGIIAGMWRGTIQQVNLETTQKLQGATVVISGTVRDDASMNSSGQMTIRLNHLSYQGVNFDGTLWVSTKPNSEIKRSDVVTVKGKVVKGFGTFIGSMYFASVQSVQRPQPGDIARTFRDWFADSVRTAIPEPEASLGLGFLVGQKQTLPTDLIVALQIAGLTHIVVASGYNLTILVRLARRLFEKISKYLALLAASGMIVGFVAITGLSPSMTRAGLVAGLSLGAWYYGRRFHPLVLLSFVMALTVAFNPSYVWGDIGWQLSFAAFAGVMILAPLLQRFFFGETKPPLLRQILGETIAAFIVTAPILIGAFGQISHVAVIANMLVLPLVPFAMLLTFIAGVGALIIPVAATVIGLPATWLLEYMISVTNYLASLPWAVREINLNGGWITLIYIGIAAMCVVLWRVTKYDLRDANIVE